MFDFNNIEEKIFETNDSSFLFSENFYDTIRLENNNFLSEKDSVTDKTKVSLIENNKKGRPRKKEGMIDGFSYIKRTDNAKIKLKRHILNFCVYFMNTMIEKFYKEKKLGKPCKFYKINQKYKNSTGNDKLKNFKISEILSQKNDNRIKIYGKDENVNINSYNKLKEHKELNDIFELRLSEFLNKFYLKMHEDFKNNKEKNCEYPKIFFSDLLDKNKEHGKGFELLLISILKNDFDVNP